MSLRQLALARRLTRTRRRFEESHLCRLHTLGWDVRQSESKSIFVTCSSSYMSMLLTGGIAALRQEGIGLPANALSLHPLNGVAPRAFWVVNLGLAVTSRS